MPSRSHSLPLKTLCGALACAFAVLSAGIAHAALEMGIALRLAEPSPTAQDLPTLAYADRVETKGKSTLIMSGNAEVRQGSTLVRADRITYSKADDEIRTEGNARLSRSGVRFSGPSFTYRITEQTGSAKDVEYEYPAKKLRGTAGCANFSKLDSTELENATVTSCKKGDNSWWVSFSDLTLDDYEQEGVGHGAVLHLAGIPVIGSPWFTFPLTQKRKSGFLMPNAGYSSEKGLELAVPYYFNIAPNYDLTLTPRLSSKRGAMLGAETRYLGESFRAELSGIYMPDDRNYNDKRWEIHAKLNGHWNGFSYGIDHHKVSDRDFIEDFSENPAGSDASTIAQNYWLSYSTSPYWSAHLGVYKTQVVDSDTNYLEPYEREPQFQLRGYAANWHGLEISSLFEATRFTNPMGSKLARPDGNRFVIDQSIAYPMSGPGWFVTPKARYLGVWYDIDRVAQDQRDDSPSRQLPILTLDSGLFFERELSLAGRGTTQTLEPRLFYAYIPYRDQSDIPIFDGSVMDFTFAQLRQANNFTGYDRINKANHLSGMLSTAFLDDATGEEFFRAAIGQRYYFEDDEVSLNTGKRVKRGANYATPKHSSDILGAVSAKLEKDLTAEANVSWNTKRDRMTRYNAGFLWQPKPFSSVSLYYRYNMDPKEVNLSNIRDGVLNIYEDKHFKQLDLAVQWPLTQRLYGVTRHNYSFLHSRFVSNILGLEYHADCWTLRFAGQRYVSSSYNYKTKIFVELELNGLGGVGSSPLSQLHKSVRGYQDVILPEDKKVGTYDYYW